MSSDLTEKVRLFLSNGMDWEEIENKLITDGIGENPAREAVTLVRKERQAKFRSRGMMLLLLGSAICLFSMVFTFIFGHDYFMLYGLTIIGVSIAFAGLVYVMG